MKIPCFIFARKNSKGLKNKNKLKINNKPLIHYTIKHAKESKYITDVVISTDDYEIYKYVKKLNCITIYPRPRNLCSDLATTESVLKHSINFFEKKYGNIDIYGYLQITEPFRPKGILDKCLKNLIMLKKVDSSFAVYETHKNYWQQNTKKKIKLISTKIDVKKPRQIKKPVYREDTGIALASRAKILKKQNLRIGKSIRIVKYKGLEGLIDIHTKDDFILAKKIVNIIKC